MAMLILVDPENPKSHSQYCQRGLQKFSLCIQPMHWDNLRHFLAVARSGSLSGAGRCLGVNPATVSRHIEQLEQELGARLFLREPSGYVRTSAGAWKAKLVQLRTLFRGAGNLAHR